MVALPSSANSKIMQEAVGENAKPNECSTRINISAPLSSTENPLIETIYRNGTSNQSSTKGQGCITAFNLNYYIWNRQNQLKIMS
jgi:hypothetical protein